MQYPSVSTRAQQQLISCREKLEFSAPLDCLSRSHTHLRTVLRLYWRTGLFLLTFEQVDFGGELLTFQLDMC